ncbi:MAG: UbiA family prenyltransferase, partial [Eubacterium sp.]|nr:UbiA family prenyltransferase [Eubacterium sp.]
MKSEVKEYNPLTPRLALQLAAPHTWPAAICPALFGDFYCWQQHISLPLWKGILLPAACILMQSSVNSLNDYFDYVKGTDTGEDNVEVSDATLVYSHIDPGKAMELGLAYLAAGALTGLLCCVGIGPKPLFLGLAGALVIFLYSGGPLPLSYLPIGEILSGFVMGGLIPLGTALCADGLIHREILIYSIPLILGIGLIMMSNNGCDIEKDTIAGRRTLPVCLGRKVTLAVYRICILLWVLLVLLLSYFLAGISGCISCGILLLIGG